MSITGHEDEFRSLFADEARQRLHDLSTQLLALETAPDDPELIASIFREAHTLKGAAAVVGVEEVALVSHAMEDLLATVRSGERQATRDVIDLLLVSVDGIEEILPAVVAGEDRMAAALHLEATLRASTEADASTPAPGDPAVDEPAEVEVQAEELPAANEHADAGATAPHRMPETAETARVPVARLDEIVRLVGESAAAHLRIGRLIGDELGVDPATVDEVRELSKVLNELQALTMRARMVPVATITEMLQRAVRDVARTTEKDVRWEVRGDDTELDRGVLQQLADPLLHMVRNAVDHGIEAPDRRVAAGKPAQGLVRFHAMQLGSEVILTVTDDGAGIDVDRLRADASRYEPGAANLTDDEALYLVFRSGLSTAEFVSDISGRGVGLDVVRSNVEAVRGRMEISTEPGRGTEFRIIVPITLAILPCLLVEAGGREFAIPMHSVVVTQAAGEQLSSEGKPSVRVGSQAVPLSVLGETLGLPEVSPNGGGNGTGDGRGAGSVVVVAGLTRRHAFWVSELLGKRDVVVKGISRLLPRLDVLAGASIEPDGSILFVLDVPGLIDRARHTRGPSAAAAVLEHASRRGAPAQRAKILVVDDALTVRELQRSILERAGYDVVTATDGTEAMAKLAEQPVDLVLTDIEMPRMNGFELTETIRSQPTRANVPILILTSRASEEDRERGLLAGADGYIVKSSFDETALLQAVERLLGR